MYPGKTNSANSKKKKLKKKMIENNIPQSVELRYSRVVASFLAIINPHMHFHKKLHHDWFMFKNHNQQENIVVS
jgi:hypothetical protein